jgi:hypothetical protein
VNREIFYFPSYEIVHDFFRDPFESDNRHVTEFVSRHVVGAFARHYCAPGMVPAAAAPERFTADEHAARIEVLERRIAELQSTCDARQKVIEELDQAARERLALVERLHAECESLRASPAGEAER